MRCKILYSSPHRLRIHPEQHRMTMEQADILAEFLSGIQGVTKVKVSDRTGDAVIFMNDRRTVEQAIASFRYEDHEAPENTGRQLEKEYEEKLIFHVLRRVISRAFLPMPVRSALTVCKALPYLRDGVKSLAKGKIEVPLLDSVTIGASILQKKFDTAGSIIFLLGLSGILEEWTHKKSVDDLARSMSLNVENAWVKQPDGEEVLKPVRDITQGEHVILRTGQMIPLDGLVISGTVEVNQSSLTGESVSVGKDAGDYVYAGTVVETGSCVIEVKSESGEGRYDRIVRMIEESEKMKSTAENKAVDLANRLVPYSFLTAGLTWLISRDTARAMSVLMVDYSCALKLAMPISVLSAMRECVNAKITVKGGRFMETVHQADTIVFDKTGTLTYSRPRVADVVTFGGNDPDEMLRIAACLEEHFPHSIANAVVQEAAERGLEHREMHSKVEYVVSHGIVSAIGRKRVLLGSYHFVFEDEKCRLPEKEMDKFMNVPPEYSQLFMTINGNLAAIICIEDPIREDAAFVISRLHDAGIRKIVMMTGDSERTAAAVAAAAGVDEYHSEVLPEDKAGYVAAEKKAGNTVLMIGDGINDSPALSEADAGIAVSDGAAIAREIADITIPSDNLSSMITLKNKSDALMRRIDTNYRVIMTFNSGLILLGIAGILPSAASAYLHNLSTLLISMHSMTPLPE